MIIRDRMKIATRNPVEVLSMKRIVWVMLMGLVFLAAGCAEPADPEPSPIIVGFAQLGSESGWRVGNTKDIEAAAQRAGVTLLLKNADQKQDNQIKAIREFIAQQVDVIAFSPIVETGWDSVLLEAKEAGIPVLLTDRSIQTAAKGLFEGFVGSNFLEEGHKAGEFLMKKCAGMQRVRIVEISGTPSSTPAQERALGFRTYVDRDPKYEIVTSVSGDFLRSKGKECMENILRKVNDIDVLFSHNDAMTLGAIEAIEGFGLVPGKDIVIITVDGEQGAIDLLKKGKINCVIECTPFIGDVVIRLSQLLAKGEKIAETTYSSERTFSEYDAELDSLSPRGY